MNREINQQLRAVSDIVYAYRSLLGDNGASISYRDFCTQLNEILSPVQLGVVHQTVKNWEDRVTLPHQLTVRVLISYGEDWRRDFALDLRAALHPGKFEPATWMGQEALRRSLIETGPNKKRYGDWWVQP